jgi:hypothetical protein
VYSYSQIVDDSVLKELYIEPFTMSFLEKYFPDVVSNVTKEKLETFVFDTSCSLSFKYKEGITEGDFNLFLKIKEWFLEFIIIADLYPDSQLKWTD